MAGTVNGIPKNTFVNDNGSKTKADAIKQAVVSASNRTANDRGGMNGMFNPGTVTGRNSVGEIVTDHRKPTTTDPTQKIVYVNQDTGGGGGGGGGGTSDDIVNMIKNLLNEQKQKADEYYKTLYEQQISQIGQQDEANRNQANLNYMRGNRYLNSLYGNGISGQGLSNRVRNNSNWQNNLASIRQNTANNKASALAQYNSGLANNASTLAQGWYNYVLPVYTNRQQWLDNLAYRNM